MQETSISRQGSLPGEQFPEAEVGSPGKSLKGELLPVQITKGTDLHSFLKCRAVFRPLQREKDSKSADPLMDGVLTLLQGQCLSRTCLASCNIEGYMVFLACLESLGKMNTIVTWLGKGAFTNP